MKRNYIFVIKAVLLFCFAAGALSSCQDWLTVYPQDKIVEENFWEDKNDLEGVRYAAYQQMCNTLDKLVLWGDLRSDTYTLYSADADNATASLYSEIRDGRIERDSASTYFDWGGIYQTINYCNKVLQHGPEILEKDKQFTTAEWLQMKAEITGLRALNYFYLIRAFKDVPYSTKVVNKDSEVMNTYITNQLVVLDSLITDVESVKGQARNRFSQIKDTKGLITNPALYAMLSDMYLWRASLREGRFGKNYVDTVVINNIARQDSGVVVHTRDGDYQKAIDYADEALQSLVTQNDNHVYGATRSETTDFGLTNCYLYKNSLDGFTSGRIPVLTAFNEIYSGNSEESIFELQFSTSEKREHNLNGESNAGGIWGYAARTHLAISDGAISAIYSDASERNRDSRMWFSAWNLIAGQSMPLPGLFCFKWTNGSYGLVVPESRQCGDIRILTDLFSKECNWIVYRISDVMLQKAEALAALGKKEALNYVNALHRRWYCNDNRSITASISYDVTDGSTMGNAPGTSNDYELAVMNERQLEFIGEGKRWFDLVRYAERHAGGPDGTKDVRSLDYTSDGGATIRSDYFPASACEAEGTNNGFEGVKAMVDKFMKNEYGNEKAKALSNRFKNRYGLYNIIYYKEIQAGDGWLEQNPVWNKSIYE